MSVLVGMLAVGQMARLARRVANKSRKSRGITDPA
jgi:hypothetical protein